MRLLLDQGLPRDTADSLRARGFDCQRVAELGMSAATDLDIISHAASAGAVVITLDADFHALLMVRRQN